MRFRALGPAVVAGLLSAVVLGPVLAQGRLAVSRDAWPAQRTGETIARIPALRSAVDVYEGLERGRLIVRYPGGDVGNDWAFELRGWLIALGIPSGDIVLEPGSGVPDSLVLEAVPAR